MRPQQPPRFPPPPAPPPAKRRSPAVLVLAIVGGVIGLCLVVGVVGALFFGGEPTDAADAPSAPRSATAAVGVRGVPPEPGQAAWDAYITALKAIDPAIVDDEEKAVDRGRNQCGSIAEGFDETKLVDLTNQRFTTPGKPDGFGEAKAKKILAAVRKHICPTY